MKGAGNPADLRLLIILLRVIRGWNQAELAKAARVDRASISDYEQGRRAPSQKTLERIMTAAGMPYSELERMMPSLRTLRSHIEEAARRVPRPSGKPFPAAISQAVTKLMAAELDAASLEIEALSQAAREETPSPLEAVQERLREESAKAETDGNGRSQELAELASRVAELSSGK